MDKNEAFHKVCSLQKSLEVRLKYCFSTFHAGTGLSPSQSRALHYFLGIPEEEIFQKDLESQMNIKPSSASAIIRQLEERGFIRRETLERDSRLKKITLTKKALALKGQVENDIEAIEKKLLKGVKKDDLDAFCRITQKMIENLENF